MARAQAAPRANSAAEPWFDGTEPDWTEPVRAPKRPRRPRTAGRRRPSRDAERRRRAQHFARRRRGLVTDAVLALILALVLISLTAGLGILLLVVVPLAAGLIAERVIRFRRARRGAGSARRARGPRARGARASGH